MRGVMVAALLAGCYQPSDPACVIACTPGPGACPSGLVCGSASLCEAMNGPTCNALMDARADMEGDPDADADASISSCAAASFDPPTALIPGYHFMVDSAHVRMSMTSGADIRINDTAPDSNNTQDYVTRATQPMESVEMYGARMDPTGTLLYVTADNGSVMDETRVYLARRFNTGEWSDYEPVTLRNGVTSIVLFAGATLGASTDPAFGKRRITLWFTPNSFEEYVEERMNEPTTFSFATSFNNADLGVTIAREPSLTPDGLRVVFVGQTSTEQGIFVSSRASVTSSWQPAVLLRAESDAAHPYLTNDCRHLYWTSFGMGYHAVRP